MRSGHKGDVSEIMVLAELLRRNMEVAIPYGNRPGYDLLVVGSKGQWKRIQVKTAHQRNGRGGTYVDFIRGSGKGKRRFYTKDDFDVLIAIRHDNGHFWVFRNKDIIDKRCMAVGIGSREFEAIDYL